MSWREGSRRKRDEREGEGQERPGAAAAWVADGGDMRRIWWWLVELDLGGDWPAGENEEGGRSRLVVGWGIGRGDPEGDSVEWRRAIGRMGQLS